LVRRPHDGPAGGHELAALAQAGFDEGIDNDPHIVVDRSLADAVVHAAAAGNASLVIAVEGSHSDRPVIGTWAEAVAGAVAAPVVIVRGAADLRAGIRLQQNGGGPAAVVAGQIAELLADDERGEDAGIVIAPVTSWELLAGMHPPDGGALLLVPEPSVPPAQLPY
jgi:hypothetical protein